MVSASLERDCQSVPAIAVTWPASTSASTSAAAPVLAHPVPAPLPSPVLRSPVRNGAALQQHLAIPGLAAPASLSPFLVSSGSLECTLCDKRFAKPDQLRLHMDIHVYQEGAARKKPHACPVCAAAHPSKAALLKHIQAAHPGEPLPTHDAAHPPAPLPAKDDADDRTTHRRTNPRPFKCTDCDTAFRGQGFLQKHLRSKLHVMKLECTGKLPFGTYALFEAANFNLAEIDTTDCEAALNSMRRHAALLQPGFTAQPDSYEPAPPPSPTPPPPSTSSTPEVKPVNAAASLLCTETAPPPSPPPAPVAGFEETQRRQSELPATPSKLLAAPEPESSLVKGAGAGSTPEAGSSGNNAKCVIADVWVPPKEDDVQHPPPQPPVVPVKPVKARSAEEATACPSDDSSSSHHSFRDEAGPGPAPTVAPTAPAGTAEKVPAADKPPTPKVHVCHFCKLQTGSGTELEVHLHADHIAMKDGNDFRCPRPNCDKIYPNRDSLRHHIVAHYLGGGTAGQSLYSSSSSGSSSTLAGAQGAADRVDGDVSRETMAALQRKLGAGGAPGPVSSAPPPAGTVGNQSPGTPEESQTSIAALTGGRKKMKTHLVALNSIPEAIAPPVAAASPLSEAASEETSSPSPHHHHGLLAGAAKKRRSLEAAEAKTAQSLLGSRRCASALDNGAGPSALHALGSVTPSYSLPAVPAHISQQAPLSWFGNGLLNAPFALLNRQHLGTTLFYASLLEDRGKTGCVEAIRRARRSRRLGARGSSARSARRP